MEAALATAKLAGWDRLVREQRELLDQHWDEADVEIEGDDELQQAVRVGMFHVLQAGLRGERQPIPAKGLTGPGYDGHTFWDTETYVLPVLTYTAPHAVRDALRWRHSTLDMARDRARVLGPPRCGVPVADDPRRGDARATGRPGRRPSTSTPTSPTPSSGTTTPPSTTTSTATSAPSC